MAPRVSPYRDSATAGRPTPTPTRTYTYTPTTPTPTPTRIHTTHSCGVRRCCDENTVQPTLPSFRCRLIVPNSSHPPLKKSAMITPPSTASR
eukprot:3135547-Pyramimonas_sp.AAC.1